MKIGEGDLVTAVDGRHLGLVEKINRRTGRARVRWFDTGWLDYFEPDEVERVGPGHALWEMIV